VLDGGPLGVRRLPTLDLAVTTVGDPERAVRLLRSTGKRWVGTSDFDVTLAEALHRAGRSDDALEALSAHPDAAPALRYKGLVLEQLARSRGAYQREEAEEVVTVWKRALELEPHASTRHRLVAVLASLGRFDEAVSWSGDQVASPGGDGSWRSAIDRGDVSDAWLLATRAHLISVGAMADAHAVKQHLARNTVARRVNRFGPTTRVIQRVQACSFVHGESTALELLDSSRPRPSSRLDRLMLDKLEADLALLTGTTAPLVEVRGRFAVVDPDAERRFAELLRGAHVLVLGPADLGQPTADDLAGIDVVIATKRRPILDVDEAPPIVVYQADASALLIDSTASRFELQVLRPSIVGHRGLRLDGRKRIMPTEDTNTFHGTRFGIQRILYDLIGRDTASITLAGVDFFLGTRPYVVGYDREVGDVYASRSLLTPATTSPHDHLWDFRFTRRLIEFGWVRPHRDVVPLLELDDESYLARLTAPTGSR
jgi:hypothetical protein